MGIINPKQYINILGAATSPTIAGRRALLIGQKTAAGTATSGDVILNLDNDNSQDVLFGKNSMLATMVRGFKEYNKNTEVDAIPLSDNGAGVKATGNVVFAGTATASGSIYVTIGSHKNNRYKIDISSADTATAVGAKLETAINADDKAPAVAVNTAGDVEIEAVNAGEEGNFITIKVDGSVAGITTTLTAMSGGATNPVLTGILTQLANIRYTEVVFPETYDIDFFVDFQEARFNTGTYRILDGIAITCLTDTKANFLAFTDAVNKKTAVLMTNKPVSTAYYKGSAIVELDYVVASKLAAISSLRLTEDADISNFIIANDNPSDALGGIGISTLPFFNTPFYDLTPTSPVNFWTDDEIDELTAAGFTVFGNNTANNEVILNDVVTRYKTNAGGDPDLSFKYLNYFQQSTVFREYIYSVFDNAFKQSRLTTGVMVNGRNMVNADVIAAVAMRAYSYLADQAVCPKGADKSTAFAESLVVTIFLEEGKANVKMLDPVVTQLRRIYTTISMDFSI